jgi:hypothetical protein
MTTLAETVLRSWKTLNEVLNDLREDQLKELIFWELEHGKREDIVVRLHQRFNKLAVARERAELLAQIK